MKMHRARRAFSLVELVIVVVILGILAAIAVPRISRGAKGAGDTSVRSNLAGIRNAIDLFQGEHNKWPGDDGLDTTFIAQLTKKTDKSGAVGVTAAHKYGPYLRGQELPPLEVGPNAGANGIFLANTGPTVDESKTTAGWIYNYATGDIIANTDDKDENGKGYDKY